ncbi:MAG: hypothetical protein KatS3mg105_1917 [Gemmatales bacterium]|nr:MAG: hypothetical protein KatS3mg105_1917 [Gemmatales bacterium]
MALATKPLIKTQKKLNARANNDPANRPSDQQEKWKDWQVMFAVFAFMAAVFGLLMWLAWMYPSNVVPQDYYWMP